MPTYEVRMTPAATWEFHVKADTPEAAEAFVNKHVKHLMQVQFPVDIYDVATAVDTSPLDGDIDVAKPNIPDWRTLHDELYDLAVGKLFDAWQEKNADYVDEFDPAWKHTYDDAVRVLHLLQIDDAGIAAICKHYDIFQPDEDPDRSDVSGLYVDAAVIAKKDFTGYYLWGEDPWVTPKVVVPKGSTGRVSEFNDELSVVVRWDDFPRVKATVLIEDLRLVNEDEDGDSDWTSPSGTANGSSPGYSEACGVWD